MTQQRRHRTHPARERLIEFGRRYPGIWALVDAMRAQSAEQWPSSTYLPLHAASGVVTAWKRAHGITRTIVLSDELLAKIKAIKPHLLAQINERGVPLRDLEPWQVVEIAINQLHLGLRRDSVRALYRAK